VPSSDKHVSLLFEVPTVPKESFITLDQNEKCSTSQSGKAHGHHRNFLRETAR